MSAVEVVLSVLALLMLGVVLAVFLRGRVARANRVIDNGLHPDRWQCPCGCGTTVHKGRAQGPHLRVLPDDR